MVSDRTRNTCFLRHTGDWSRFSCRYFRGRLSQETCAQECAPLAEAWRKNICASCAAKRDSKELMPHSAFSRSWAARLLLRKKMESTSSMATAVQLQPP